MKRLPAITLFFLFPFLANAASESGRYNGDYLHKVTTDFVTPHLDWGKPLAGGPIDALFITNRAWGAREVVELAQRLELKFDTLVGVDFSKLTADSAYESRVQGTSLYEKNREVDEKLERPYPVFVMANFTLSALEERAQYRILSQVAEGSGLVIAYPWNFPFQKLFAQPTEEWRGILSMVTPIALPEREAALPEGKLVKTYRFGKGRIVVLDYGVPQFNFGLTPRQKYTLHGWKARYENAMALTARAVLWAAGRPIDPGWNVTLPEGGFSAGAASNVTLRGEGDVRLRLRNEWNQVVWEKAAKAAGTESVPIPPLAAGKYFLDLRAMEVNGKAIRDFGVFTFNVASPVGGMKVASTKTSHEPGEPVAVTIRWEKPLVADAELKVTLDDLPDRRRWAAATQPVAKGSTETTITLPAPGVPTAAGLLLAELRQGDQPLVEAHEVVYFPRREKDLFPAILWGSVRPELPEMYALQLRNLYPNGIATSHSGKDGSGIRLAALFNQRFMPHDSIISIQGGEDGLTSTRVWLANAKKESEAAAAGDGSFYNPKVQAYAQNYVRNQLEGVPELGPAMYNLGDENNFSYEVGYTPSDEAAYRRLLQEWYGDIASLNTAWGTQYADFATVEHPRPSEMRKNQLYPHWYAHRRFMERQYADANHFMADQIRALDPHAVIGAEGSQPGDLELTVSKLDYWGPYTDAVNDELLRTVARDKIRTIWWGYGGEKLAYPLWKPLLTGVANGHAWYSANIEAISGFLAADLTMPEYYRTGRQPYITALNRGPAQLMTTTPLKKSPVAMLWSQASYSASFMNSRFFNPRDIGVPMTDYFYRKGIGFDWITTRMLENGVLGAYRVLILPGASALSEKETAAITAFTNAGGVVIADLNPGILNGSCRPLEASSVASLFGTPELKGKSDLVLKPLSIRTTVRGREISLEAAKVQQSPEIPLFNVHPVGKGLAILLNFNLSAAINTATTPVDAFLAECLQLGGVEQEIRVEGIKDEQMILRVRQGHGFELVGMLAGYPYVGKKAQVHLPQKSWVYEVDRGLIGATSTVDVALDLPFRLYACFPEKQTPPVLELVQKEAAPGDKVELKAGVLAASALYRLEVTGPDGQPLPQHMTVFSGRKPAAPLHFALNDAPGTYLVTLTDIRTGLNAETKLLLKPSHP